MYFKEVEKSAYQSEKIDRLAENPFYLQTDPLIRRVWEKTNFFLKNRIVPEDPWLRDVLENRVDSLIYLQRLRDNWQIIDTSFAHYFAIFFENMSMPYPEVVKRMGERPYTYVDWCATPGAVETAPHPENRRLGISVGLRSHRSEEEMTALASQSIYHVSGSIFDPMVHAHMLERLNGEQIDFFTFRPLGALKSVSLTETPQTYAYLFRIMNFVYKLMSPNGVMYFELPKGEKWETELGRWSKLLTEQRVSNVFKHAEMSIIKNPEVPVMPQSIEYKTLREMPLYQSIKSEGGYQLSDPQCSLSKLYEAIQCAKYEGITPCAELEL